MSAHLLAVATVILTAGPTRDPLPTAAAIDREIEAKLASAGVAASGQCSDAEFLRRASLEIIGRIPTASRAAAFLADTRPDKRRRLIDDLLADSEYGEHFGTIWYHLLIVPTDDNRQLLNVTFDQWLSDQFNKGRGWDQIVRDILTAKGTAEGQPPTVFWLSHVEGAKERTLKPAAVAGAATQRFLGTQYQCAECHNHPFTGFKQTEFWSLAAFFGHTEIDHADRKAVKQGKARPSVAETGGKPTIAIPEKNTTVSARFPDGADYTPSGKSLRADFAAWCTSPKNEAFAKAAVNRLWGHFFGRGIVHPVDDFREDNPATHPDLLSLLGDEFTASGYDLKHLIRCVCLSAAYQRSSDALPGNSSDDRLYSHMAVKMMSPEVLFDSLSTALGEQVEEGRATGRVKPKGPGSPKEQFLRLFDTAEERDFSAEYSHGIPQVLRLMNGNHLQAGGQTVQRLMKAGGGPAKIVEGLYLATLSRRPTPTEVTKMTALAAKQNFSQQGYADVMWVLLNSAEFILNH